MTIDKTMKRILDTYERHYDAELEKRGGHVRAALAELALRAGYEVRLKAAVAACQE